MRRFDFVRAFRRLPQEERVPLLLSLGLVDPGELADAPDLEEHQWHLLGFARARQHDLVADLAAAVEETWRRLHGSQVP